MFVCVVDIAVGYLNVPCIIILVTVIFFPSIVDTDVPWLMISSEVLHITPVEFRSSAPRLLSKNFFSGPLVPLVVILNRPPTLTYPFCRLAKCNRLAMISPPLGLTRRCIRRS